MQVQGIGFMGLLALIFMTLKLTGVITWSWWLVWLPLYGGAAVALVLMLLIFLVALIVAAFE